jgi:hypothetical protein
LILTYSLVHGPVGSSVLPSELSLGKAGNAGVRLACGPYMSFISIMLHLIATYVRSLKELKILLPSLTKPIVPKWKSGLKGFLCGN